MVPMSLLYQDSFRRLWLSGCLDVTRTVEGSAIAVMNPMFRGNEKISNLHSATRLNCNPRHKSGADMCHSE